MEGPTTREHLPPRINSAARSLLTVPHSLLSLIRCTFRRRGVDALFINVPQTNAGFPPCSRPRVRHSGEERFKRNDNIASDSRVISFVSYFSLSVRDRKSPRSTANWSHHCILTQKVAFFSS